MWQDAQRRERECCWAAVERYLAGLPPRLFEQARLLEYDLAIAHSSTGRFADIFLGAEQFPALSLGGWLLADLGPAAEDGLAGAEERLLVASVLLAARTQVVTAILDRSSPYESERLALAQLLTERTMTELAAIVPASSPFWAAREAASLDGLEAAVAASGRHLAPVRDEDPEAWLVARWSTPAKVIAGAALELAGIRGIEERVGSMLEAMAEAFEIMWTLESFHADLLEGRVTYAIAVVARAAGLPLRPGPDPRVALGALVATGSLEVIVGAALVRLQRARAIVLELGLPTFATYLADAEAAIEARHPGALPARRSGGATALRAPARRLVSISRPSGATALAMAEGFLLADRSFRESWETHREGMFGAPLVASRFPAGLLLEILMRHGLDVSADVDGFLESVVAAGFRYYDHPACDVDTDTIGVFLRLEGARASRRHDAALGPVLERLRREVAATRRVPVWLPEGGDGSAGRTLHLGEGCGTVAGHLLLGLLAYAPERYGETIERGSTALLDRIADVGLGANVNYPRWFALSVFGRLMSALETAGDPAPVHTAVAGGIDRARPFLLDELQRSIERPPMTAQDAALLTLACLDLDRGDLVQRAWTARILKAQRSDGAWPAEAFAAAPTRGASVTWYSSALLTTALCYDALARTAG